MISGRSVAAKRSSTPRNSSSTSNSTPWSEETSGRIRATPRSGGTSPAGSRSGGSGRPTRTWIHRTTPERNLPVHGFLPSAPSGGKRLRGAFVFIHGGGWTQGEPSGFFRQCAFLAANGWAAFAPAYRLVPEGVRIPDQISDVRSALAFVKGLSEELSFDPGRIVVAGGSAGAHLAACALWAKTGEGDPSPVSPVACAFLNGALHPGSFEHSHRFFRDEEERRSLDPFHLLDRPEIGTSFRNLPLAFFHGTRDLTIPWERTRSFHDKATGLGARCRAWLYEGEDHAFFNYTRGEAMARRVERDLLEFLDQTVP